MTSALANSINPYKYLTWLLNTMPNTDVLDDDALDTMLPFSDMLPDMLKMNSAQANKALENLSEPLKHIDMNEIERIQNTLESS